jgi:hypothetical protein
MKVIQQNGKAYKSDPNEPCKMLQFGFHPLLEMVKIFARDVGHFRARSNDRLSDLGNRSC